MHRIIVLWSCLFLFYNAEAQIEIHSAAINKRCHLSMIDERQIFVLSSQDELEDNQLFFCDSVDPIDFNKHVLIAYFYGSGISYNKITRSGIVEVVSKKVYEIEFATCIPPSSIPYKDYQPTYVLFVVDKRIKNYEIRVRQSKCP